MFLFNQFNSVYQIRSMVTCKRLIIRYSYLVHPPAILAPYSMRAPPMKALEGAIPSATPIELEDVADR